MRCQVSRENASPSKALLILKSISLQVFGDIAASMIRMRRLTQRNLYLGKTIPYDAIMGDPREKYPMPKQRRRLSAAYRHMATIYYNFIPFLDYISTEKLSAMNLRITPEQVEDILQLTEDLYMHLLEMNRVKLVNADTIIRHFQAALLQNTMLKAKTLPPDHVIHDLIPMISCVDGFRVLRTVFDHNGWQGDFLGIRSVCLTHVRNSHDELNNLLQLMAVTELPDEVLDMIRHKIIRGMWNSACRLNHVSNILETPRFDSIQNHVVPFYRRAPRIFGYGLKKKELSAHMSRLDFLTNEDEIYFKHRDYNSRTEDPEYFKEYLHCFQRTDQSPYESFRNMAIGNAVNYDVFAGPAMLVYQRIMSDPTLSGPPKILKEVVWQLDEQFEVLSSEIIQADSRISKPRSNKRKHYMSITKPPCAVSKSPIQAATSA